MNVEVVNFFFDAIFLQRRSQFRTPFHRTALLVGRGV